MKIILANGTELSPLLITGSPLYVQGAKRDTLTFVFPATESMEALDKAFSETACETIKVIEEEGSEFIHKSYVIKAKMEKTLVEVEPATSETEAVTEERIFISMAQRTYLENQLASLTDTVDVLVMESLMN